jgi:acyl dehydratase
MTALDRPAAPLRVSLPDLATASGAPLGPSRWLRIDQERINLFADATDDHQWIHVDERKAAEGPFGGTIAHGFLTLSLIAPLLKDLIRVEDVGGALNYGLERVRFPAPVPAGSEIRASGSLASVEASPGGTRAVLSLAIEVRGQAKPACVFDLVVLYKPA